MNLLLDARRVDDQAGIMPHHHTPHMHLTGDTVDLHIGHPGSPRGAKARPFAVDVAGIGEALALQDVALRLALLRLGARPPERLVGSGANQLGRTRVVQVAQPVVHRIDAGGCGQLIDVRLMGKRVGHGRHTAQPGGAHQRCHVIDADTQVVVGIGRPGGTVAHFVGLRQRLDGPGQQQGQCRRAVGRVGGLEIVGGDRAVGGQATLHLHQLGGALGLPQVLLLPRQLHPHRRAHGARQQRSVGRHIVSAVAAVTACRLHADHIDRHIGHAHQARQVKAQHERVLGAGPDGQPGWPVPRPVMPVGNRAGRANRRVHLVGPEVGARHGLATRRNGLGQGGVHITFVHQLATRRRVVAQGLRHVLQVGHARPGFPADMQFAQRLLGLFFALGHDADKVAHHHHRPDATDVGDGRFVHRFQRVTDEIAMVSTGIGRAHHTTVQHAGDAHIVHIHLRAGELVKHVQARHRLPHQLVIRNGLDGGLQVQQQSHMLAAQGFGQAQPIRLRQLGGGQRRLGGVRCRQNRQFWRVRQGGLRKQPGPGLGGRASQRLGVDLQRRAGDGGALVWHARRVTKHHVDLRQRDVQFLCNDLRQRGSQAGAHVHMPVQGRDAAIVPDRQQDFHAFSQITGNGCRLARHRNGRRWRLPDHQQHALGGVEIGA